MSAAWVAPALGTLLGVGLVLSIAPWLWPAPLRPAVSARSPGIAIDDRLRQAGVERLGAAAFLLVSGVVGVIATAAAWLVVAVPIAALLAGALAALAPWAAISARARRRRHELRRLWPDAVDHLVASLRAGVALPEAVAALGAEGPAPLRPAFAEFAERHARTAHFASSIDALKERLADPIADRMLETLRMAREVGGTELTAVLGALARGLREELAIRAELEGRQSWLVNAARLGVAAPWITLVLLATRAEAAAAYRSAAGGLLIAVALGVSLLAYRAMLALGRLPEDRRWFR